MGGKFKGVLAMWMGKGSIVFSKRSVGDILKTLCRRDLKNPIKVSKLLICRLN
uniref:Uncharacterized protein n=1 Tax=Cucumis melo TaxID=3656 RepID=A0A9I9DYB0_CUCME